MGGRNLVAAASKRDCAAKCKDEVFILMVCYSVRSRESDASARSYYDTTMIPDLVYLYCPLLSIKLVNYCMIG